MPGRVRLLALSLAAAAVLLGCRAAPPRTAAQPAPPPVASPVADELAQFARVEVPVDASALSPGDTAAARRLGEAGALLERAFWQQSYRGGWELRSRLLASSDRVDRQLLLLVQFNAGPFDRLRKFEPFDGSAQRPPGGGFYPEDLREPELDAYLAAHPGEKEALLSPWTVVHRREDRLVAVPFHEEFGEWIRPAAARLREAAALVSHPGMAAYLRASAEGLLSDSYGASDSASLAARGSALVVFVGPQTTAYDRLKGVKQAYAMTVGLRDEEEDRRLAVYRTHFDAMEQHLPLAERHRRHGIVVKDGMEGVLDLSRAGGIAHGSLGSMTLPADPKARPDGGRNLFWVNVLEARGEAVVRPIARALLAAGQESLVTARAYYDFNMMHYVGHDLGPHTVESGGRQVAVKEALGDVATTIEETKAEIAGLDALDWAVSQGVLPAALGREHYFTFIPHTFQILYQGTQGQAPPPHAQGARLILNWCRDRGALTLDSGTAGGRWRIDAERLPGAIHELLAEILEIQATGDRPRAQRLLDSYAVLGPDLTAAAARVGSVRPLAMEPAFKVRWR